MKLLLTLILLLAVSQPGHAACDTKKAQSDPGFPASVSAVANVYTATIFTGPDGTVNLLLDPEETFRRMKAMHGNDYNCLELAASRFLIEMVKTSLKRHKAEKVNDTSYQVAPGNKHTLSIDVFKPGADEPFIRDVYQLNGGRYRFVKTERFEN